MKLAIISNSLHVFSVILDYQNIYTSIFLYAEVSCTFRFILFKFCGTDKGKQQSRLRGFIALTSIQDLGLRSQISRSQMTKHQWIKSIFSSHIDPETDEELKGTKIGILLFQQDCTCQHENFVAMICRNHYCSLCSLVNTITFLFGNKKFVMKYVVQTCLNFSNKKLDNSSR